jgi:hypothetical protein
MSRRGHTEHEKAIFRRSAMTLHIREKHENRAIHASEREQWTRFIPKDGNPPTEGIDVLNAAMLK